MLFPCIYDAESVFRDGLLVSSLTADGGLVILVTGRASDTPACIWPSTGSLAVRATFVWPAVVLAATLPATLCGQTPRTPAADAAAEKELAERMRRRLPKPLR